MSEPGHLRVVQEEQVAAVALHEVRLVAALFPVVAAVTEGGVQALTEIDEVVVGATEGLVGVGSTVGEVLAGAAHQDVKTRAGIDGVVAGTALRHVVAREVGDDVVTLAAERDVRAGAALDPVVAAQTPERVVVVAAADAVDGGRAVVDRLGVDPRRVNAVELAVIDASIRLPDEHQVFFALGRWIVRHGVALGGEPGRRTGQIGQLELAIGGREGVRLQGVDRGVAAHQLGEGVAFELGAQVHARGAGQVVQPVAVLQIGQLVLEHVVERGAQQPTERGGDLREAAHPEVDIVQTGDRAGAIVGPGIDAVHECGGVCRDMQLTQDRVDQPLCGGPPGRQGRPDHCRRFHPRQCPDRRPVHRRGRHWSESSGACRRRRRSSSATRGA